MWLLYPRLICKLILYLAVFLVLAGISYAKRKYLFGIQVDIPDKSYGASYSLQLGIDEGAAYTRSSELQHDYFGYDASLTSAKAIQSNLFSLYYYRRSGDSTEYGSVPNIYNAGIALSRSLEKYVASRMNLSAYNGQRRLDNPYNILGYPDALALSLSLGNNWVLT